MRKYQDIDSLGKLIELKTLAHEWREREVRLGGARWAGIYYLSQRAEVQKLIEQHAQIIDGAMARRLIRSGKLPGVRDIRHLVAFLVQEDSRPDNNATKQQSFDTDSDEDIPPGIAIFDHGVFDQAKLTDVRHATHLMRHLDDYHEPTFSAIRRRLLRTLADVDDPEQRQAASAQAADLFLQQPVRWRNVVEVAIFTRALRAIEDTLGERIRGPRRTKAELAELVTTGIEALHGPNLPPAMREAATEISNLLQIRLNHLESARVVLMHEEHSYLQLTGITSGRSIRRHLPKGLHLIYSDQIHRREDRTASLWLVSSDEEHQAEPYYYARAVPPAYAAKQKQRRAVFRLPDEDSLRRYAERDPVEKDSTSST